MRDLPATTKLLKSDLSQLPLYQGLEGLLHATLELLSQPGNVFSWSSWANATEARAEVGALLAAVQSGNLPPLPAVAILFAPTGPLQEVSVSSGWAEIFSAVASKFDALTLKNWQLER